MMKEVPWPGRGSDDPCAGCRYHKECKGKKNQCRKKFRALVVKPRTSGQCAGCRYHKECRGKKNQCRKKFRALVVKPRTSGQRGPKS